MRTPLLVANWKMNKTMAEARVFVQQLQTLTLPADRTVVICAPFTCLSTLQTELSVGPIAYGAQTMHWAERGAFTGEISAPLLLELGCRYVIIGHSERRRDCNETDVTVNKKVQTALHYSLIPIVCVGESLQQRQANATDQIIRQQVTAALANCDLTKPLVIAYEPIWAIGTGLAATAQQAQAAHSVIRQLTTPQIQIIYGGSVTPADIAAVMVQPDIDGVLVGGASLLPADFTKIVSY